MGASKRKPATSESAPTPSPKRFKVDEKSRKDKTRVKDNVKQSHSQKRSSQTSTQPPKPVTATLLAKEQPAFPRGGAGLLTPLEKKQIQIKANKDALAEENGSKDLFGPSDTFQDRSDSEGGLDVEGDGPSKTKPKTRKKRKVLGASAPGEKSLRIEGLKHKHLVPGTLILGQVTRIGDRGLTLALPNNLVGYVSLTAVSEQLSGKIQKLVEKTDQDEAADDTEGEEDISLGRYFHIGQFLRTSVVSTIEDATTAKGVARKRIELSIDPELANAGLTRANLVVGCTVQASVVSVEDHGLIVDLGIEDGKPSGFIPAKELDASINLELVETGTVLLCMVTDIGSNGRTIKLSAHQRKLEVTEKSLVLKTAPSVDSFLPGTAVDILISKVAASGLVGKVMGMLDVTADVLHSGAYGSPADLTDRFEVGKKVKGRLLFTHSSSEARSLGFSVLPSVLSLLSEDRTHDKVQNISLSDIISDAEIVRVEPGLGVYMKLPTGPEAFAHISRLADGKTDTIFDLSGPFKLGSKHRVRILEHNSIDGLFIVSLQESILNRSFLRVEDVKIGQVVKGHVQKLLIGEHGVKGIIVYLAEGIDGLVPQIHLSDIVLQHPEKKFREGSLVTARVLSTNVERRQIRLTLKKTLVNSDQNLWRSFSDVSVGDSSPGTLVKVDAYGALVQFYGDVKGFLPVAEMSEAYIKDATEHFRVGQVVTVSAINVEPENRRLSVSCRDMSMGNQSIESALASLKAGSLVSGKVFEKSGQDLLLRLEGSNAIARLSIDHVADGSGPKRQSAFNKIRVNQALQDLVLLEVHTKRRLVVLSNKSSLTDASKKGRLLSDFADLQQDMIITGFVSNITSAGVFVGFAAGITGLIPERQIDDEQKELPDFGFTKMQAVNARVFAIDYENATPRFWLTIKESTQIEKHMSTKVEAISTAESKMLSNTVDDSIQTFDDLAVGKMLKVRVVSVKDTQMNVEVAKDIQGRIDVSEVFDSWQEIKDRKKPLQKFSAGEILSVRILGAHDARNHRFLPISHRSGKTPVLELSAKSSLLKDSQAKSPGLSDMTQGSSWLAFVNNIGDDCLWVNVSPNVRGRVRAIEVADDLSLAGDLEKNFPIGSAMRVRVVSVDEDKNRLDLSARQGTGPTSLTLKDLSKGTILPGRITRVSDRQVLVQLGDNLVGAVDLIDMADDYSLSNPANFQKNDIVRVCVTCVDSPNKKVNLSLRPSKVMSSTLPVKDPEVTSAEQLKVNDVYRGFICNVADKGVFVMLGHGITAFVRVTNLSDTYLKEWKDHFQRDQLVKGKIMSVDAASGHVQMSLKASMLRPDYKPPLTFADMHVGDTVIGKVAKVESFGVFILVDNSENVRGLCHRSEIAERRIEDVSTLFNEGDAIKAKVLKVDVSLRRVNFGMKASYFADDTIEDGAEESEDENESMTNGGVTLIAQHPSDDQFMENPEEDEYFFSKEELTSDEVSSSDSDDVDIKDKPKTKSLFEGLSFNFNSAPEKQNSTSKRAAYASDTEDKSSTIPKKKKSRTEFTAKKDVEADAIQYHEQQVLREPNSSLLWLEFMAYYIELGDIDQGRNIGERALKTIDSAEDSEKLNIWVALLRLENAYGSDESVRATLERAIVYNDPQETYSRLVNTYISSGKHDKADILFQEIVKLFSQDPKVWINYATFLFDTAEDAERARELLPKALGALPAFTHLTLTSKFAQLEFRSKNGLPERGRTIFEGLLSAFPKRVDLYNVLLDLETNQGDKEQVRALFERVFTGKLKPKQAKFFFKRWLAFEEKEGDERSIDEVKAKAAEYVRNASGKEE